LETGLRYFGGFTNPFSRIDLATFYGTRASTRPVEGLISR